MTDIVEQLRQRDEYDAVLDHEGRVYWLAKSLEHDAADEIERLRAERDRLREALQWMVDNDETNEGDEPLYDKGGRSWNEINAYWIDGLNRARAALKETGHEADE